MKPPGDNEHALFLELKLRAENERWREENNVLLNQVKRNEAVIVCLREDVARHKTRADHALAKDVRLRRKLAVLLSLWDAKGPLDPAGELRAALSDEGAPVSLGSREPNPNFPFPESPWPDEGTR